jgi:23S rRNA A2030 N6-methylase RlmJ
MKEEKDDLERVVEGLRNALKEQEQNAGMFAVFVPIIRQMFSTAFSRQV